MARLLARMISGGRLARAPFGASRKPAALLTAPVPALRMTPVGRLSASRTIQGSSIASSPIASIAYSALLGAIMVSPLVPSVWITPRPEDLGLIAGFLAFALMGQAAMFSAFHFGEASLLSPFHFVQIVGATLFGYWFFGDFPEPARLSGIAIIIASGIYIAVREAGNSRGAQ